MSTQLSPTTVISPTHADAILLKTYGTSVEDWIRSQTLYPAELRAHPYTSDLILLKLERDFDI